MCATLCNDSFLFVGQFWLLQVYRARLHTHGVRHYGLYETEQRICDTKVPGTPLSVSAPSSLFLSSVLSLSPPFFSSFLHFSLFFVMALCQHGFKLFNHSTLCPYNIQLLILFGGGGGKAWIALHMCVKVKDDFIFVVCKVNLCSHQIIMMVLLSLYVIQLQDFLIIDSWLIFIMICLYYFAICAIFCSFMWASCLFLFYIHKRCFLPRVDCMFRGMLVILYHRWACLFSCFVELYFLFVHVSVCLCILVIPCLWSS